MAEYGEGNVRKRGKIWWIDYMKDGKRVRESSGSPFRDDAVKLLKDRLANPVQKEYLVSDILDMLLQDYQERGKKGVYKSRSHLKPVYSALGRVRVVDVTEERVEAYQGHRKKTHANGTINRECQMLGQALKLALRKKIISRVPYIRKLEEFNVRRDFLEPWEVEKVIGLLPDYLQDLVRFAHLASWRKSEISGLTWDDVQSTAIRLGSDQNKTGHTKMLPIDDELRELLERRNKLRLDGVPWVFHRKGEYIRDFRKAWNKAIKTAGYEGRVFHCLRRSGVRAMIRAGVPDTVAMSISGHKTRAMLDRYNISSENDILRALQQTRDYRLSQTLSQGSQ